MPTNRQLPSGKWQSQVYCGKDPQTGKPIFKSFTAKTKKAAIQKANAFSVVMGKKKEKMLDPVGKMTLGEAMNTYIEIKTGVLSTTTIEGYKRIMRNDFLDIQPLRLCDLTSDILQRSINYSATRPSNNNNCKNGLSKKSLKNAVGFLNAVLNRYYPDFNYHIDIPKGNPNEHKQSLPDITVLTNNAKGTDIELAIWLGLLSFRLSEVLGFRKTDCDLENGYIKVNQTIVYSSHGEKEIRPYAKTEKSMRSVKLPQYVIELIQCLPKDQEYLVPMHPKTLQSRFKRFLEKNNMEHMRFHDLRHIHASITYALGIDEKNRQEMGGWSNSEIMNGTYTAILPDAKREAENKVAGYFDQIASQTDDINYA